ncbi:MAG: oligosaccharide flippase family protein [Polaribacter sp.]|nr:oligosaccharide flippase family protein [Polaribacter sp.]
MIKQISFFLKSNNSFIKNFSKLFGSAIIAQLIPVFISPIISRLYSVEDFGVQGIIFTIVGFCFFINTLRYENIIIIDRALNPIKNFFTVKKITLITSVVLMLFLFVSEKSLTKYFNLPEESYLLLIIPFIVYVNSSYELLIVFNNRIKNFNNIAKIKIYQSSISGLFQLGFGILGFNYFGLILAPLISKIIPYLKSKLIKFYFLNPKLNKKEIFVLKKYKNFPLFDLPTMLINNLGLQLPIIFLATNYSAAISGYYFMAQRILQVPITLISHSILEVFKERISSSKTDLESRKIMFDTLFIIISVAIIPFTILFYFIDDFIIFYLGEKWVVSAKFAKILVPSLFFRFISYPISYVILVKQRQKINLLINIITLCVVFLIFNFNFNVYSLIINLSILFSAQSLVKVLYSFYITKIHFINEK